MYKLMMSDNRYFSRKTELRKSWLMLRRKDLQRGECKDVGQEMPHTVYRICQDVSLSSKHTLQYLKHMGRASRQTWILDCTQETSSNTVKPLIHLHTQPYIRDDVG